MLKSEHLSSYSRHNDYYQLWLDKKKENHSLISHLLNSKKVITTLHVKLTDILQCIKIFESSQVSFNFNTQEHEASDGSHLYVADDGQNISPEVNDQARVTPERSEFVEMDFDHEITPKRAYPSQTQLQSDTILSDSMPSEMTFKPNERQDTTRPRKGREETFVPSQDIPMTRDMQEHEPSGQAQLYVQVDGQNIDSEVSVAPGSRNEFVELEFDQEVATKSAYPSRTPSESQPETILSDSLHPELVYTPDEAPVKVKRGRGRPRKKPRVQEDVPMPCHVQDKPELENFQEATATEFLENKTSLLIPHEEEGTISTDISEQCRSVNVFDCIKIEPVDEVEVIEDGSRSNTESTQEYAIEYNEKGVEIPNKRSRRLRHKAKKVWSHNEYSSEEQLIMEQDVDPDFLISNSHNSSFSEQNPRGVSSPRLWNPDLSESTSSTAVHHTPLEGTSNEDLLEEHWRRSFEAATWDNKTKINDPGLRVKKVSLNLELNNFQRLEKRGETRESFTDEFEGARSDLHEESESLEPFCTSSFRERYHMNIKRAKHFELEEALFDWFKKMLDQGVTPRGTAIQKKAIALNEEINGIPNFTASGGWLYRWKQRRGIPMKFLKLPRAFRSHTFSS